MFADKSLLLRSLWVTKVPDHSICGVIKALAHRFSQNIDVVQSAPEVSLRDGHHQCGASNGCIPDSLSYVLMSFRNAVAFVVVRRGNG